MVELRAVCADDWRAWRAVRLQALADAPEAFSSRLADWQGEGDVVERWRRRLLDVPFNIVAELDGRAAGMVSATHPDDDGVTLLISMWVAPFARGRGVGDRLVRCVLEWARGQHCNRVILDVREANVHAIALYRRHGFIDDGRPPETQQPGDLCEKRMTFRLS